MANEAAVEVEELRGKLRDALKKGDEGEVEIHELRNKGKSL